MAKSTPLQLEKFIEYLGTNQKELNHIFENVDKFYRRKEQLKTDSKGNPRFDKNGKSLKRILYPSTKRLFVLQEILNKKFLNKISLPNYVQGGVKGASNVTNARLHKGNKYKFLTDVKMFFPSINHRMVYKMLTRRDFTPKVASMITKLTTYKGMIPQGAPTSTSMANLVFYPTSHKLNELSKSNDIIYSQYVDDLTFTSKKDFKELIPQFIDIIEKANFRICVNKTNYRSSQTIVTGIQLGNNKISAPKNILDRLNDKTLSEQSLNSLNGYVEYISRVN